MTAWQHRLIIDPCLHCFELTVDDVMPGGRNEDLRLMRVMLVLDESTKGIGESAKGLRQWLPHVCCGPAPTATVGAHP